MHHHGDNCNHVLGQQILRHAAHVHWTLPTALLYEHVLTRGEAVLSEHGALVVHTGKHTGRAAHDKYIVREEESQARIWWGNNTAMSAAHFDALHRDVCAYLRGRDVFVQDCFAGADAATRLPLRIITEYAWHSVFARHLMIKASEEERVRFAPRFCVLSVPGFKGDVKRHGLRSPTFIVIHFAKGMVLIGGTEYAGEIKKAVFTVMNDLLPTAGVLPMHSAVNIGQGGDVAVFFGLSGTGKTTLSADASRVLIGDDEHGWSDAGVFNIEGGCYAKVIGLSQKEEPQIYATTQMFGALLENVAYDSATRQIDVHDKHLTENTRCAYPLSYIANASASGIAAHPTHIIFLTCDAFGVLPPLARLTSKQALYHFISGYTARIAGTEKGLREPTPVFSPCYGGPFLPLHPMRYATMLVDKMRRHKVAAWLINTGWSGGGVGIGKRISLCYTRAMVNAVLSGALDNVPTRLHEIFGLHMPVQCPGVPQEILDPEQSWGKAAAYREQSAQLAARFAKNFAAYQSTEQNAEQNTEQAISDMMPAAEMNA